MSNTFTDQINEALDSLQEIIDFSVKDVNSDPELVDIVIRGRLKPGLDSRSYNKKDPVSDYDRAMKGLSPCDIQLPTLNSDN